MRGIRFNGLMVCACGIAWACTFTDGVASADPPNVLVILADDLGFSDVGCYGGEIDTPHVDRLAAGGLRFTQGYNTARCWPSRAALLTGFYAQAIHRDSLPGGDGGANGVRPAWARLLPELLKPAGYHSYHSGKWHVDGDPRQQGFDRSLDINSAGQNNYFDALGIVEDGKAILVANDFYTTTAVGDHAVRCLADHARAYAGTPFFQYVAFTSPHFPLHAPQKLVQKYRERYRAGWNAIRLARERQLLARGIVMPPYAPVEEDVGPPYDTSQALAILGQREVNRPLPWNALTGDQQDFQATKMAIHAAMVDAMDQQIGRILDQLQAMNAFENTLVFFASDNGASAEIMIRGEGHAAAALPGSRKTFLCLGPGWSSCANTPFRRHKTWVHEGGIATPWILHWPNGIASRGELRHQPVHFVDVAPTVLHLAGVSPPKAYGGQPMPPMQGRSFAKALSDSASPVHDTLWWCHEGHRAVRVGDWKLVAAKNTPWELYNYATDRCETIDLATKDSARTLELLAAWNKVADECRELAAAHGP